VVIRMQPHTDNMLGLTHSGGSRTFTWVLTCNMLHVMIEAPHSLHTHNRSSSYIYNAIQHLLQLQRLEVIRMPPHTDIRSMGPVRVDVVGVAGWSVGLCWFLCLRPPIPFILMSSRLYTYIMQFSTCYSG
jgi:hypothetical protein